MPIPLPPVPTRIVAAPMAGGPTTPELVAAVGDAGGLGFLAAGYQTAARLGADIDAVRRRSCAPFGVNVFAPVPVRPAEAMRVPAYAAALADRAAALGTEPGIPRHTDDEVTEKVECLLEARPDVVAFTFGLPPAGALDALHARGVPVLVTVTSVAEAVRAADAGVDGLVVQGWEAGAHRGGLADGDEEQLGLLPLLRLVRRAVELPLVAAGGLGDGAAVAAVLVAGAAAAMLGTAFLRCPEAGTYPRHADALAEPGRTVVTRAFTGRRARALVNGFVTAYGDRAPAAYPEVHYLTAPLRAAARARGGVEDVNLWAGQAHELARALPAGELVRRLAAEARTALADMAAREPGR